MPIYLLEPKDRIVENNENRYGYSWYTNTHAVVVRAKNKTEARNLADEEASGEGMWKDGHAVTCSLIETDGDCAVIVASHGTG